MNLSGMNLSERDWIISRKAHLWTCKTKEHDETTKILAKEGSAQAHVVAPKPKWCYSAFSHFSMSEKRLLASLHNHNEIGIV